MISLEQAKQLVTLLENEQQQEANLLVKDLYENASNAVIEELGELTRDLHEAIKQFSSDERMSQIANDEIPDAGIAFSMSLIRPKMLQTKPWTLLIAACQ